MVSPCECPNEYQYSKTATCIVSDIENYFYFLCGEIFKKIMQTGILSIMYKAVVNYSSLQFLTVITILTNILKYFVVVKALFLKYKLKIMLFCFS